MFKTIFLFWLLFDFGFANKLFTTDENQWLEQHPTIRLASMSYWPVDDQDRNIHTEYIKLLSKYANINISLVAYDKWETGFQAASKGEDVYGILNLSYSKEREEKYFEYCSAYYFTPAYLVVKNENNTIKSLEGLANQSIYLKSQSITKQIIANLKYNIEPLYLPNDQVMVETLSFPNSKAQALLIYTYDLKKFDQYGLKVVKKFSQNGVKYILE